METDLVSTLSSDYARRIDPGWFGFYLTAREGVSHQRVEDALTQVLERIRREGVTDRELQKAINQVRADLTIDYGSVSGMAGAIGKLEMTVGYGEFDRVLERIRQVTAADVQRVAGTYFGTDQRTVGWFVPQGGSASPQAPTSGRGSVHRAPEPPGALDVPATPGPAQDGFDRPRNRQGRPTRPPEWPHAHRCGESRGAERRHQGLRPGRLGPGSAREIRSRHPHRRVGDARDADSHRGRSGGADRVPRGHRLNPRGAGDRGDHGPDADRAFRCRTRTPRRMPPESHLPARRSHARPSDNSEPALDREAEEPKASGPAGIVCATVPAGSSAASESRRSTRRRWTRSAATTSSSFHATHYRPDRTVLVVVGDRTPEEVARRRRASVWRLESPCPSVRPATPHAPRHVQRSRRYDPTSREVRGHRDAGRQRHHPRQPRLLRRLSGKSDSWAAAN